MNLRVRRQADDDVLALTERIGANNPRAGSRSLDRALWTFQLLATFPETGTVPPVPELEAMGLRVFTVSRFRNYVILYRPLADGAEIVRVLDGRRESLLDAVD